MCMLQYWCFQAFDLRDSWLIDYIQQQIQTEIQKLQIAAAILSLSEHIFVFRMQAFLLQGSHCVCSHRFLTFFCCLQIMKEIQENEIKIYEFPETEDEEEMKMVKKIKVTPRTHTDTLHLTCTETHCRSF